VIFLVSAVRIHRILVNLARANFVFPTIRFVFRNIRLIFIEIRCFSRANSRRMISSNVVPSAKEISALSLKWNTNKQGQSWPLK